MNYHIILNRKSGGSHFGANGAHSVLSDLVERAGHRVSLHEVDPSGLEDRIRASANSDADVIVVGGGDGSIATAASILQGTRKVLGILPLGTFNLAARAVDIPTDPLEAMHALLHAEPAEVDLLEVNHRPCLCLTVLGFYPHLAKARQNFRRRPWWMKAFRVLYEMLVLAVRTPLLDLMIETEACGSGDSSDRGHRETLLRTRLAVFCPGSYRDSVGLIPEHSELDAGKLSAYVMEGTGRWTLIKAGFGYLCGKLLQADEMNLIEGRSMTFTVSGRASVTAMLDGEIVSLALPCELVVKPRALRVLHAQPKP